MVQFTKGFDVILSQPTSIPSVKVMEKAERARSRNIWVKDNAQSHTNVCSRNEVQK
ncbi:Hypothetical predicted protein, partial [Olea europaea subsp. europaea]